MVKYSKIKEKLRTFDLLLTRYDIPEINKIAKYKYTIGITLSQWVTSKLESHCHYHVDDYHKLSHVSLIVRPEDINIEGLNPNHLYMITMDGEPKIINHKYGNYYGVYPNGDSMAYVHIKDLDLYLKSISSTTKLYVAPMKSEIFYSVYDSWNSVIMKNKLTSIFREYEGNSDQRSIFRKLAILIPLFRKEKSLSEKVTCSEFVAIVLKKMGFLPEKINEAYFIPIDFIGYREKIPCLFGKPVKIE